jgi:hypothetical protein
MDRSGVLWFIGPTVPNRTLPEAPPARKSGIDQRRHPRVEKNLQVRIFKNAKGAKKGVDFQASVKTRDISAGGMFIASTFFLKKGAEVEVEFKLPPAPMPLHVTGEILHPSDSPGRTGFAIRFTEFHGDAEIYLRAFLVRGDVHNFVSSFAAKNLSSVPRADHIKLVEMIIRWEILQEGLRDD